MRLLQKREKLILHTLQERNMSYVSKTLKLILSNYYYTILTNESAITNTRIIDSKVKQISRVTQNWLNDYLIKTTFYLTLHVRISYLR